MSGPTVDAMPARTTGSVVSPDPIVQVATGFMAAKQLFAASSIGLFAALANQALTEAELAQRLGIAARSVRILADAMVGLGLLTWSAGRYANTPSVDTYLSGRAGLDLRPHLAFWDAISYPHWQAFTESIRATKPAPLDLTGERKGTFFTGVQTYNSAHALMLADNYDFGAHQRVLDLAGLSSAFLAAAADRNEHLRGTFFAEPAMVEFAGAGLPDRHRRRITLVTGNPLTDPVPTGHDAVLLEHVVHRFDAADNHRLLAMARQAVEPGARLLVLDFFLDETEQPRAIDALLAGEYLVIDGTVVYPEAEVREWVAEAGWRWLETRPLPGSPKVLIAEAV